MNALLRQYASGAGAHVASRGVEIACGFASVWLLTRSLALESYGALVVALTVLGIVEITALGGIERVVIFRVSRAREHGEPHARRVAAVALRWALAIGALTCALAIVAARALDGVDGRAALAGWLGALALRVPAQAPRTVSAALLRGQGRVAEAIALGQTLPSVLQVLVLGAAFALGLGAPGVVAAHVLAPFAAGLVALVRAPLPLAARLAGTLGRGDAVYGAKLALTGLVHRGVWSTDVLLLGWLAGDAGAGRYGVAAKIAVVAMLVHQALGGVLMPRLGPLLVSRDVAALEREYRRVRAIALAGALGVLCGVLALGEWTLGVFGADYVAAAPALFVLAAAYVVPVAFGHNGALLNMGGFGGWSLATSGALLVANVALSAALIPAYGALGAALGTAGALLAVNAATSAIVRRTCAVRTVDPFALLTVAAGWLAAALAVARAAPPPLCALLPAAALAWLLTRELGPLRALALRRATTRARA